MRVNCVYFPTVCSDGPILNPNSSEMANKQEIRTVQHVPIKLFSPLLKMCTNGIMQSENAQWEKCKKKSTFKIFSYVSGKSPKVLLSRASDKN